MWEVSNVEIPGCRVERVIGRGGSGVVLTGVLERTGERVAIKIASTDKPLASAQLRREIDALTTIEPPTVPRVYDSGAIADGAPYVVMEYITWPTLRSVVGAHPNGVPLPALAACARAILDAVAEVHLRGLCHCDLKPDNLFVDAGGAAARLIDFGMVQPARGTDVAASSNTASIVGTAAYMSPEQCSGDAPSTTASDVYSLGVILYEILTGRTPFDGTPAELRHAHMSLRPPRPSRLCATSAELEEVVMRCLAKSPGRRFPDAVGLRKALVPLLGRGESVASPAQPTPGASATSEGGKPAREQRVMSHVFFQASTGIGKARDTILELGGQLGYVSGTRLCAVFDTDAGKSPVSRALRAAEALLDRRIIERAIIDLSTVTVRRRRKDGALRLRSRLFSQDHRFPAPDDPPGILISKSAAETVPDLVTLPEPARDDLLLCASDESSDAVATVIQGGGSELIGREEVLDELLRTAMESVGERTPGLATVIADAGFGKSHLCATLLTELRARAEEAQHYEVRAPEPVGGEANETFRTLLQRVLWSTSRYDESSACTRLTELLGTARADEAWPAIRFALGWIDDNATEIRRLAAVPRALRDLLVHTAATLLARLAAERPVFLVLDDAQFADEMALDAIELATQEGARSRLWVCTLARPALLDTRPNWGERCPHARKHWLGPLDQRSAATLCRRLLHPAEGVPTRAIDRIVDRTRGIPLLLVELTRGLKREGIVRKHERGDMWYVATDELDALPRLPLVEWLARRELDSLPPDLAAHTRLLSLLGAEFEEREAIGIVDELDRLGESGSFPLATEVAIRRLVDARLLVLHRDRRIGFRHALVRDSIAASTPPETAACVHQAACRYYRDSRVLPDQIRLARLAHHAAASGLGEEASDLYLELATRGADRHAYMQAEQLFSRVLELAPEDRVRTRFAALQGRGLMRYRLGRYGDALADLEAGGELTADLSSAAAMHVLLDEATVLDWTNEYRKSEERVARARELATGAASTPLLEARLLLGLGRSHYRMGRWDEARDGLQEAVAAAGALGDAGYETLVIALLLLTIVLPAGGRTDEAERTFDRVVELCEERGDRMHLAGALNNRRVVCIARKRIQLAIDDAHRCIEISRELGIVELEYVCSYNLGELLFLAGDLEAAWPHVRRAVELEQRRPAGAGRPVAVMLEARLLSFRGDRSEAGAMIARLRDHQHAARRDGCPEAIFLPSEQLLFTMVELATGDAEDAEWEELRERAERDSVEQEELEVIEMHGLWLERSGRRTEAARVLSEALALAERTPTVMDVRIAGRLATLAANPV